MGAKEHLQKGAGRGKIARGQGGIQGPAVVGIAQAQGSADDGLEAGGAGGAVAQPCSG